MDIRMIRVYMYTGLRYLGFPLPEHKSLIWIISGLGAMKNFDYYHLINLVRVKLLHAYI